jgi:hypothetical protein
LSIWLYGKTTTTQRKQGNDKTTSDPISAIKRWRVSDDGERSAEVEGATSRNFGIGTHADYNGRGKTTFGDVKVLLCAANVSRTKYETFQLYNYIHKYRSDGGGYGGGPDVAGALSDLFPVAIDISQRIMFNHG